MHTSTSKLVQQVDISTYAYITRNRAWLYIQIWLKAALEQHNQNHSLRLTLSSKCKNNSADGFTRKPMPTLAIAHYKTISQDNGNMRPKAAYLSEQQDYRGTLWCAIPNIQVYTQRWSRNGTWNNKKQNPILRTDNHREVWDYGTQHHDRSTKNLRQDLLDISTLQIFDAVRVLCSKATRNITKTTWNGWQTTFPRKYQKYLYHKNHIDCHEQEQD